MWLWLVVLTITACTKATSDQFVSYTNNPLNDTVWSSNGTNISAITQIIIPDIAKNNITDSFNSLVDNTLTFGDSLQVVIPANACTNANGTAITTSAKIKMDITLLRKKGDFIKHVSPTTNVISLLEAGNYVDIKLSRDGQEIKLDANNPIKIRVKDIAANSNMKFFSGAFIKYYQDTIFSWSPSFEGKVDIWKSSTPTPLGYEFTTNKLRWIGCSYFFDSLQPKTRLNVVLPSNHTNKNTALFLVLKNKKTVVSLLNHAATKTFFTHNIPVGTEATLVSLTKINANYYLGSKAIKVTNGDVLNILPEKKTLEQIVAYLNSL
jgi:hypothetical protein